MVAGEVTKREKLCILGVCLGNRRFSLRILHQGNETRMGMGKGTFERHGKETTPRHCTGMSYIPLAIIPTGGGTFEVGGAPIWE